MTIVAHSQFQSAGFNGNHFKLRLAIKEKMVPWLYLTCTQRNKRDGATISNNDFSVRTGQSGSSR